MLFNTRNSQKNFFSKNNNLLFDIKDKYTITNFFTRSKYKTYIGLIDVFDEHICAETELILRFKNACEKINVGTIVISPLGYITSDGPLKNISILQVDPKYITCIIACHHIAKKIPGHYTLLPLWNPVIYMESSINYIKTFDGYLSSHSSLIDNYIKYRTSKTPIGYLTTSICEPLLDFSFGQYKCFYIGTNWDNEYKLRGCNLIEKISSQRNKTYNLIKKMDDSEFINIYGPEGRWNGFKSYIKSIPFDGVSVVYEIQKCGICLCLSTENHIESEVSSMRIFEGIAAGVPLICDKNPFYMKWFGDNIFYIDTDDPDKCFEQIKNYIEYFKNNNQEVLTKISNCRDIFNEHFRLDKQFQQIITNIHQNRQQNIQQNKKLSNNRPRLQLQF